MKKPKAMSDAQFWRKFDRAVARLQRAYVDLEEELYQLTAAHDECEARKTREAAA